jgi:HEAT repeat protein
MGSSRQERALARLVRRLDVTDQALRVLDDAGLRSRLAGAGLADAVERRLVRQGDKWQRVAGAGVLGQLGSARSLRALRVALGDADPDVAYAAAQALSLYPADEACEALLDALSGSSIPPARVAALLEGLRSAAARELIERRARSADPSVRYWVAYLLGRLADRCSLAAIEALADDSSDDVRAAAAESLARFGAEATLARLLRDQSWVVRSHAAKAAGSARATELAPRLAELLEDEVWWVRQNAALALSELGDRAVAALLPRLHSADRFARNKAAEVLVRIGYAAQQLEALRGVAGGAEGAREFLVALGRAEALGTIEAAVRRAGSARERARLLGVLDEIAVGRS